jgi:DNA-binding LacI/PurR family transcriptional regulator
MARKKSMVTIQDVAAAAGVSVSTVSRVLNDRVDVAQETYDNIQRVISELGYTSSLAAKSFRSRKKPMSLAWLCRTWNNPFASRWSKVSIGPSNS